MPMGRARKPRVSVLVLFGWIAAQGLPVAPAAGQIPVYSNQKNGGSFAFSFTDVQTYWDDLDPTQGGLLSSLSIIISNTFSGAERAEGRIDLTYFDEDNDVPQGELIGSILFDEPLLALPTLPPSTFGKLLSLDNLQSEGLVLPETGRIGIGIEFFNDRFGFVAYSSPTIGSSPGDLWVDDNSTPNGSGGGDLSWKVLVDGVSSQAVWIQGSGYWEEGFFWDIGRAPDASQDVILRGKSDGSTGIGGPATDTQIKSLTIGDQAFLPAYFQMTPGVELTVQGTTRMGPWGTLAPNGGTLVTHSLDVTEGTLDFQRGMIRVKDGALTTFPGLFFFGGSDDPTVILDHADLVMGSGPLDRSIFLAHDILHTANLMVTNGTQAELDILVAGSGLGAQGRLVATGSGTVVDIKKEIRLGEAQFSTGRVDVQDGAVISTHTLRVGSGGSGLVEVSGGTLNIISDGLAPGVVDIVSDVPSSVTVKDGGVMSVDGTITVGRNGTLEIMEGGALKASSFVLSPEGRLKFQAGALGVDTFSGDLVQQGGTFGVEGAAGHVLVSGRYHLTGGALAAEIAGAPGGEGHDTFQVGRDLILDNDAEFRVSLLDGFTAVAGDIYEIISAGTGVTGRFGRVSLPEVPGLGFQVLYGQDSVSLSVVGLDGDLNGDGFVGLDDLHLVLVSWQDTVQAGDWSQGDISGDGHVGLDDLNRVLANWNASAADTQAIEASIPESATGGLLGTLSLWLLSRGRHRRASSGG